MEQQTLYYVFGVSTVNLKNSEEYVNYIRRLLGLKDSIPEELSILLGDEDFIFFHPVEKGCPYGTDAFHERMTEKYKGILNFFVFGIGYVDVEKLAINNFSYSENRGTYSSAFKLHTENIASRNLVRLYPYNPEDTLEFLL